MLQTKTDRLTFQEKQYVDLVSPLVNQPYDIDTWEEQGKQKRHLEKQTKLVAEKLYSGYRHHGLGWSRIVSVNPYRSTDLYLLGLFSKGVQKLDNFRNISFLPIKARQTRNKLTKELSLFVHRNPYLRTWLFTDKRTTLVHLRSVIKKMHRNLSKLNGKKWMKKFGARFVFRTTELGEIYPVGESDVSVHPHMHALMTLDRKLSKEDFILLNKKIQSFWGAYSRDSGKIRNPREMVKYCVKPNDLDALNSQQIVKLYYAQNGLHLVQSLQDLRLDRKAIRENNQKVIVRKGVPKVVPSWNRSGTKRKPDRFEEYCDMLEDTRKADALRESGRATPRIVAWCTPSPLFTHISEPVFMVHGLKGRDPIEMFEREEVTRVESAIMVHTNTLTVSPKTKKLNPKDPKYESEPKIPERNLETAGLHSTSEQPF